jgi:hypothetical protein
MDSDLRRITLSSYGRDYYMEILDAGRLATAFMQAEKAAQQFGTAFSKDCKNAFYAVCGIQQYARNREIEDNQGLKRAAGDNIGRAIKNLLGMVLGR